MINISMPQNEVQRLSPKIAVIGVGGAGGNAVNNMISANLEGCEFLVANTDAQALQSCLANHKVQLGTTVTGGLGAGSKPEVGQAAAEESLEELMRYLDGANMAFVTAGMGGGTGTGAAPVIAKACRQQGILTVGVVTKPFHFEGTHRMEQAERGIAEMQQYVDTLIVIPNQNLFRIANEKTTFAQAFEMADSVLQSGVRGITDLIVGSGLINLDFADIRTAMLQMGKAMMGTGEASGDKRAVEAAEAAIKNPLLDDVSMNGASGVIINVTGGYDMTLFEADEACNRIRDEVAPNANIIFGATFDESMEGIIRVSIVATGIETEAAEKTKSSFGGTAYNGGGFNGGGNGGGGGGGQRAPVSSGGTHIHTPAVSAQQAAPQPTAPMPESEAAVVKDEPVQRSANAPMFGRDVVKSMTVPTTPLVQRLRPTPVERPAPAPVQEQKQDATSLDMFEQGEFVAQSQHVDTSNTVMQGHGGAAPVLRGQTVDNAFIPPEPMAAAPEYISGYYGEHTATGAQPQPRSAGSLHLNPPKMTQETVERKPRTPSLFERITGSVQQRFDTFRDDAEDEQEATLAAPSSQPADMRTPAAKPAVKIDDELDIPAFLRRQAN